MHSLECQYEIRHRVGGFFCRLQLDGLGDGIPTVTEEGMPSRKMQESGLDFHWPLLGMLYNKHIERKFRPQHTDCNSIKNTASSF